MLILGQKPIFLGPTIFKIPQPNWYFRRHICFTCRFPPFATMLHECLLIFPIPHSHVVILTLFLSLWGVRMWQVNENRRLTFVYNFILKNNVLFLFTSHSQTAGNLATVQCTTQRGVLARFFHHKESKVETEVRFFCNFLELTCALIIILNDLSKNE